MHFCYSKSYICIFLESIFTVSVLYFVKKNLLKKKRKFVVKSHTDIWGVHLYKQVAVHDQSNSVSR